MQAPCSILLRELVLMGMPSSCSFATRSMFRRCFCSRRRRMLKPMMGGAALSDPFCFVHGATSKADPGQAKEILPLAKDLFLLVFRQTAEHLLVVQVSQGCAFRERKEPQGIPFAPEVVK